MLQTVLYNFCTMVAIIACVTLITFCVSFIISMVIIAIDNIKQHKIKDQTLKQLYKKINSTIQDMDKQSIDKNNEQ